jgi:hypothetical protein
LRISERVLLEYRYSDYFKLELGRSCTATGYYNLAFRHSGWRQTATARPPFPKLGSFRLPLRIITSLIPPIVNSC